MKKPGYFPQLTGIRAIAAYMVFIHHYIIAYQNKLPRKAYAMLSELHIGVTVFFVLSGFLIAYRYMDKVEVSRKWVYQYFKNRVARIYPMYFLLTTAAFLYYHYHNAPDATIPIYLLNITFLRGFFSDYKFTGIAQGWSLTVEECFYALAPVMFLLRKRINIWVIAIFTIGFALMITTIFKDSGFHGFFGSPWFVFNYTYFGRCVEFIIGIQLAIAIKKKQVVENKGFAYTIIGAIGIIACLYLYTFFPAGPNFTASNNTIVRIFINSGVCAAFISILFYGLITEMSLFRTFLSTSLMKLLGESSYIFYLIHLGFIYEMISNHIPPFSGVVLLMFIVINIASIILYKFIEHPLNNWIRSHFN